MPAIPRAPSAFFRRHGVSLATASPPLVFALTILGADLLHGASGSSVLLLSLVSGLAFLFAPLAALGVVSAVAACKRLPTSALSWVGATLSSYGMLTLMVTHELTEDPWGQSPAEVRLVTLGVILVIMALVVGVVARRGWGAVGLLAMGMASAWSLFPCIAFWTTPVGDFGHSLVALVAAPVMAGLIWLFAKGSARRRWIPLLGLGAVDALVIAAAKRIELAWDLWPGFDDASCQLMALGLLVMPLVLRFLCTWRTSRTSTR